MALYNSKWELPVGYIEEHVTVGQFTDGGGASGTYQMRDAIPVGAHVLASIVTNVAAFTGNTSAALIIGDGTDADRYNTGTPSVFAAAAAVSMGVPSGTQGHVAAIRPTLTVTSADDFTAVTAGALDIRIVYVKGI